MEFTGVIKAINQDFITGDVSIIFSVNEKALIYPEYERLKTSKKLRIEAKQYRKRRSLDANALLWKMIGEIASMLRADKWDIYLQMLKRYGKYTYIVVKPNVVEAVKKQWREIEEIGEVNVNGVKAIQLLCYFGSSTLDTNEFSILLDGVISEAKELGIETLAPAELQRMKEQWGFDIEKTV